MVFITIFHHHLGEYVWFTFSIRIEESQIEVNKFMSNQFLGYDVTAMTYVMFGKFRYPWEGTLAVVPKILPYIALYNHYIIHLLVVHVGIYLGYSSRLSNFSL